MGVLWDVPPEPVPTFASFYSREERDEGDDSREEKLHFDSENLKTGGRGMILYFV